MNTFLSTKNKTARKKHVCNWCGLPIEKGEEYKCSHISGENVPYVWKSHIHCQHIADFIHDYVDPYDGYTSDCFCDGAEEIAKTFFCPFHCSDWDKETKECKKDRCIHESTDCMKKFHDFEREHELYLDTSDKYPSHWAWKVKKIKNISHDA